MSTNGKSALRTAPRAEATGLDGDKWRKPKRVQPPNWLSLIAQSVKNLPAMQETVVLSVGQEDPLEKEMATLPVFLCQLQIGTRALPTTEQQRHLPRASTEIEPHAAIASSFNNP